MSDQTEWTRAIVKVGGGRGFVVATDRERFVITAGHCLPRLPPSTAASPTEERTYAKLLGPIGRRRPTVWAECVFVDPVADLAVLGSPDTQALYDEAGLYKALGDAAIPLTIGALPLIRPPITLSTGDTVPAWLLSLRGEWFRCEVIAISRALWVEKATEDIVGGMSGSPIVSDQGKAIGVVCLARDGADGRYRDSGPNPFLSRNLPAWLLDELVAGGAAG